MSTNVEELVREGIDRLAAVTEAPAGLVGRARRHLHQRRLAAAAAGGAAAITAAAITAAAIAGGAAGGPAVTVSRPQTTAYVIGRVDQALAGTAMVFQTTTTFSPPFPAITQWSYRHDMRAVQSGIMHGTGIPWAHGRVSFTAGTAIINGKRTWVQADYRHHLWYRTSAFLIVPNACTGRLDVAEFNSVNWPGYIRQTLACGKFTIAGHARVNGTNTIKINGSMTEPHWWPSLPQAEGRGAMHVHATLYVNPSSYLPVRVVWNNWSHAARGGLLRGSARQDIQVMPPTPANIAKATVTIPAGFRKVPGFPFGGPVFPFVG